MSKGPAFSIEGILALTVLLIFFIPVFVVSCVCRARGGRTASPLRNRSLVRGRLHWRHERARGIL